MYDILKFQIKEITSAKITDVDEEKKLIEKRNKLKTQQERPSFGAVFCLQNRS